MFRYFKETTGSAISSLGSGLSWILSNKKSIAIFALMMTTDSVNAAPKCGVFHFECGSFELVNSGLEKFFATYKEPISFSATFDDNEGEKECFSTELGNVLCQPPLKSDKNCMHVISNSDDMCAVFNSLLESGKIKNPSRFFNKDSRPEAKGSIESRVNRARRDL